MSVEPYYADDAVTIYHGDCREVLPAIGCFDALVSDPPFALVNKWGVADRGVGRGRRRLEFSWDDDESAGTVTQAVALSIEVGAPDAVFVFTSIELVSALVGVLRDGGMTPKPYAWVKAYPPPPMPGNWWPSSFDLCLYAYRSGAWFGDVAANRRNVWVGDSLRHGNGEKVGHPNQKPLDLLSHIVGSIVPRGGVAIDPFAGSGSMLVAAKNIGRKAIGIEIEEKYAEVAAERCRQEVLAL